MLIKKFALSVLLALLFITPIKALEIQTDYLNENQKIGDEIPDGMNLDLEITPNYVMCVDQPNTTKSTSLNLSLDVNIVGCANQDFPELWYKFTISGNTKFVAFVMNYTSTISSIQLYKDTTLVTSKSVSSNFESRISAGTYYIRVLRNVSSLGGAFSFNLNQYSFPTNIISSPIVGTYLPFRDYPRDSVALPKRHPYNILNATTFESIHGAIDIRPLSATNSGDNVYAFANGTVERIADGALATDGQRNKTVVVKHSKDPKNKYGTIITRYAHTRTTKNANDYVNAGAIIASMGPKDTMSEAIHLHFVTQQYLSSADIYLVLDNTHDPQVEYFSNLTSTYSMSQMNAISDSSFLDSKLSLKKDLYYSMNFLLTADNSVLNDRNISATDISNFINENKNEILETPGLYEALLELEKRLNTYY